MEAEPEATNSARKMIISTNSQEKESTAAGASAFSSLSFLSSRPFLRQNYKSVSRRSGLKIEFAVVLQCMLVRYCDTDASLSDLISSSVYALIGFNIRVW